MNFFYINKFRRVEDIPTVRYKCYNKLKMSSQVFLSAGLGCHCTGTSAVWLHPKTWKSYLTTVDGIYAHRRYNSRFRSRSRSRSRWTSGVLQGRLPGSRELCSRRSPFQPRSPRSSLRCPSSRALKPSSRLA